ncbi:MAG: SpoIIE family protein phosphatase [Ignavibacteriaceae bacterium]
MPSRILVVDDEPDLEHLVQQKFRKKIKEREFEFVFAHNGVDALNKLNNDGEIELILTDINMPEMDGLTLLTELSKLSTIFKSVVVSAYGDMENIRTAMNRGAYDFVTKPIDLDDLETTINKAIKELQVLKAAIESKDRLTILESELKIATEIQTSIIPQTFPAFPDRTEFEVFAKMIPAKEVGGDFYDFFAIDKSRIGVVIGDVSGKGVPAAMLMAISRTLLKATALKGISPDICLTEINNIIAEESLSTMFVSLFYGILDTRNGNFECCNAGHNLPYIIPHNGEIKQIENVGGLFIGAFKDSEYEPQTITLKANDSLFLYTDGVTEAMDKDDNEFGDDRLNKTLHKMSDNTPTELTNSIIAEVKKFSEGTVQSDDITYLVLKYYGKIN